MLDPGRVQAPQMPRSFLSPTFSTGTRTACPRATPCAADGEPTLNPPQGRD